MSGSIANGQVHQFAFAHTDTVQAKQEIRNIIVSIAGIPAGVDVANGTLTVRGTALQTALAEWLFGEIDTPAPVSGVREYAIPGAANDVVEIVRSGRIATPQELQELINGVRSVGEVQRVVAYSPQHAMVIRGPREQIRLAAWLARELDTAGGSGTRATLFDDDSRIPPAFRAPAVRIFFLPPSASPLEMQEMINTLRSIAEVPRVVGYTAQRAIVLRATPRQVKLAEWLVDQLAISPGAGVRATAFEDDHGPGQLSTAVRVLYLPAATTPVALHEAVSRLREQANLRLVVGYSAHPAITLRGTDAQAAEAERLMK